MPGPSAGGPDEPTDAEPTGDRPLEPRSVHAQPVHEPIDAEIVEPPAPVAPAPDYDERGVPSFDYVRERIERRTATAQGTTELTGETPESRTLDEQIADRDAKAAEKLAELRRTLGLS